MAFHVYPTVRFDLVNSEATSKGKHNIQVNALGGVNFVRRTFQGKASTFFNCFRTEIHNTAENRLSDSGFMYKFIMHCVCQKLLLPDKKFDTQLTTKFNVDRLRTNYVLKLVLVYINTFSSKFSLFTAHAYILMP